MNKIYLHIGYGKTGTSLIQSWLANNAKILKDNHGIEYPIEDNIRYSRAKEGYISSGNIKIFNSLNFDNLKTPNNILLFSHEGFFSKFFENKNIQYLLTNSKLKIFIYTRNPIEYLISRWHQYTKSGLEALDFQQYIEITNINIFQHLIDLIHFYKDQNIDYVIRNYSNYKKNLIQTFLSDILNKNVDINQFKSPKNSIVNRSHDEFELELIQSYSKLKNKNNNFNKSRLLLSDYFINFNPEIKSYKPLLDIDTYKLILTKFKNQIDTLNKLLPDKEKVIIEDFEKFQQNVNINESNLIKVSKPQIHTLSKFLVDSQKMLLNDNQINFLFDLSKKMHKNNDSSALNLIRIAKQARPNGPRIDKFLRKFEEIYSNKKNETK
jgi:hypothetical protein